MKKFFLNNINYFLFFFLIINLIYIKNISYFKFEILQNSFNKKWIPIYSIYKPEVLESKKILKKNNISKFNLFGNLIDDEYFHYRIITYNYPTNYDSNANFFLYLKTEKITRNCKKLDEGKYLMLIKC